MKVKVIITSQRSGSTRLVQKVRSTISEDDAAVYEEIFLDVPTKETASDYTLLINLLPELRFYEQEENVETYLSAIARKKKLLVFKVMLDQITPAILRGLKVLAADLIYFERGVVDCAISSSKIKSGLTTAHISADQVLEKQKVKLSFRGALFVPYYVVKNIFYRVRYRKLLSRLPKYSYPNFDGVIEYILRE